MRLKSFTKGQTVTEIALIIMIVALALVGMEVYLRRGLQAKVKNLTDNMIGKEQSIYQQDTSGLEINASQSKLNSGSTATVTESTGGQRAVYVNENSTTTYESESQDASGH